MAYSPEAIKSTSLCIAKALEEMNADKALDHKRYKLYDTVVICYRQGPSCVRVDIFDKTGCDCPGPVL